MKGLLLLSLALSGCSLAPSDDVLREVMRSTRSWCFMGTSIYANIRISGTGLPNGRVSCTMEGMTVQAGESLDNP